jgi:hypothetical protein
MLLTAVAGVLLVDLMWPPGEQITLDNYNRVQRGMTFQEVKAILGRPGDYTTGPTTNSTGGWKAMYVSDTAPAEIWMNDGLFVVVSFDASGRAVDSRFANTYRIESNSESGSVLGWVLPRLKREWRRWFSK